MVLAFVLGVLSREYRMRRATLLLVTANTLAFAPPLAGQAALALAAGANEPGGPSVVVNRALLAAALKPSYRIHLASEWPQFSSVDGGCINGGEEVLDGTVELTSGGNYLGTLERRATIRFCGAHGTAREACSLTLRSTGPVAARGEVHPFTSGWTNPVVELQWSTTGEGNGVAVEGNCPAAFNDALQRMYLGVTHVLEFSLPVVGDSARTERLDDYGWTVEVK
jgi:hypothetical protein